MQGPWGFAPLKERVFIMAIKIPKICFIRYTIADLAESRAVNMPGTKELRRQFDILIIDDDFIQKKNLTQNGFQIIQKQDIEDVRDVEAYSIILCDIRGVGAKFEYEKEGAALIREIKKLYPNKKVIAYTGSTYDPTYNEYLERADAITEKGTSIDDWIQILDEQICKCVDPKYQWDDLRQYLIESNVSTIDIAKLEDRYVQSIMKKDFSGLSKLAASYGDAVNSLFVNLISSTFVKLITGG